MIWRGVFLLAGVSVLGVEAWGTFDFLYADQGTVNYIVAGGCLITVLSGILPAAASKALEDWRPVLALIAWLLVPLSLIVVFMATISRTGGAADKAQAERTQATRAYEQAQKTVTELERTLRRQEGTAEFECSPAQKGRGAKCTDANKDVADTQAKLTAARAILVKAPAAEQVDSLSVRIAAMTGGRVTQDQARMFQPAILPIIMSLVGAVLVAVGARSPRKPKPPKQKEAAAAPEPAKAPEPVAAPEPVKQIPAPRSNVVRITASRMPVASIPKFIADRVEPAPGANLPLAALYAAYRAYSVQRNEMPEDPEPFIQAVQKFAQRAGIPISLDNGVPHCGGVKLSA